MASEKGAFNLGDPSGVKRYSGDIRTTTQFVNGITTVQYPFPNGRTYVFYWTTEGELAYLNGNKIEGGANNYSDSSISVNSVSIKNNSKNAPLASALTSDGYIHIFYPDPDDRTLSEAICNPLTLKWSTGNLSGLRLKVHLQSGIGAWSEPILKVVLHTTVHPQRVTEAWWNTHTGQWESIVIS
ncbi:hypothetical protein MMC31_000779 [Peltigera leucophlebia]|nr:hypothetical protein [Peltigera leucophlebia]